MVDRLFSDLARRYHGHILAILCVTLWRDISAAKQSGKSMI